MLLRTGRALRVTLRTGVKVRGGGSGAAEAGPGAAEGMLPCMWALSLHDAGTTWLVDSVQPVTGA